jgi:probable HAF family extracellular repeat protein
MCITAMTLFAALAIPVGLIADDDRDQHHHKHHHYKLIDIGTFGGPASLIVPNGEIGSDNPVNSKGHAVGTAATSAQLSSQSNIICGGLEGGVPNVNQAFLVRHHTMINLGSLGGTEDCSIAVSINTAGEIAGSSENGVVDPISGINELRGVRWHHLAAQDLGTLGGNHSLAAGINSRGQIVGLSLNQTADAVSMYYFQILNITSGTQTRAVLWDKDNRIHDLGTLGGSDAWGTFINERGQVSGFSYTSSDLTPDGGLPPTHPFLWDPLAGKHGKMYDLGTLGGSSAGSEIINMEGGLNNLGHVVGTSLLRGDQSYHPFFWQKGKRMKDLGTLGGECAGAGGINDSDEVVGRADVRGTCSHLLRTSLSQNDVNLRTVDGARSTRTINTTGEVSHAFLWRPGMKNLLDLGTIAGDMNSYAAAINSKHQTVGVSATESQFVYRAFLWESGGPMVDLNTLIPHNSPLYLNEAFAINDQGDIVGIGTPQECMSGFPDCGHAFLLIPCDEDHPGIEDCDYNPVDEGATAAVNAIPATQMTAAAKPGLPLGAGRQSMRPAGLRSTPWYRGFRVQQPQK